MTDRHRKSEKIINYYYKIKKGVAVKWKQEIYSIIRNAAKNGAGVIVVSSELDELIELSDRIIMINNGQIVGEKTQKPFNDQEILSAIS